LPELPERANLIAVLLFKNSQKKLLCVQTYTYLVCANICFCEALPGIAILKNLCLIAAAQALMTATVRFLEDLGSIRRAADQESLERGSEAKIDIINETRVNTKR